MASDLLKQSARLEKRLHAIPASILAEVRPALVASAQDLATMAQSFAPEDEGDLRASIEVTPPGAMTPPYAANGGRRRAAENQALVTAGNENVRHAHLVEFGTEPHQNGGQFEGTVHPGTTAQPFLMPAERLTRERNRRRIGRAIGRAVRKEAQGGAA